MLSCFLENKAGAIAHRTKQEKLFPGRDDNHVRGNREGKLEALEWFRITSSTETPIKLQ